MNNLIKTSLILLISASVSQSVYAAEAASVKKPIALKAETNAVNMEMVIKDNFVKAKYASAENRFLQGNVKAAHDDYEDLISRAVHDDTYF